MKRNWWRTLLGLAMASATMMSSMPVMAANFGQAGGADGQMGGGMPQMNGQMPGGNSQMPQMNGEMSENNGQMPEMNGEMPEMDYTNGTYWGAITEITSTSITMELSGMQGMMPEAEASTSDSGVVTEGVSISQMSQGPQGMGGQMGGPGQNGQMGGAPGQNGQQGMPEMNGEMPEMNGEMPEMNGEMSQTVTYTTTEDYTSEYAVGDMVEVTVEDSVITSISAAEQPELPEGAEMGEGRPGLSDISGNEARVQMNQNSVKQNTQPADTEQSGISGLWNKVKNFFANLFG